MSDTDASEIDFTLPPEGFYHMPGADPGLSYWHSAPEWFWRTHERAHIVGVPLSRYDDVNEKIEVQIRRTQRMRTFTHLIEFNSAPVILEDASFVKSFTSAQGKWLLNGAAGTRLRNNYKWKHVELDPETDEKQHAWFDACQARSPAHPVPVIDTDIRDMDFAIEARNTFNFYHFITESLPQLCALDGLGHRGRIFIHYPNATPSGFVMGFIKALFPELADRVKLQKSPKHYDRVLSAFSLRHYYYQASDEVVPSLDAMAPAGWIWQGRKAYRASQGVLWQNSVDTNLLRLRTRALKAIEGRDVSHLPRRFWVGRSSDGARTRSMKGEAALVAALKSYGFGQVEFEKLEPLDQIAVMANAEAMISYHGAGFTNMLFANKNTHVIEIGTLQTALYRWADFQPHAHAAGCRYTNFFADHNTPTPQEIPAFSVDSIVPVDLAGERMNLVVGFVAALFDMRSPALTTQEIGKLTNILRLSGLPDEARKMINQHSALIGKDFEMTTTLAELCKETGDFTGALDAMEQAFRLDKTRYRLLQRIVHLARKADKPERIAAVMKEYKTRFPRRYDAFVKELSWYKEPG